MAGCGSTVNDTGDADRTNDNGTADGRIACARGASPLAIACDVARTPGADGDGIVLTLTNPDGGFHRLRVGDDGKLTAADGAAYAVVTTPATDAIDVRVGQDRYRLPLTLMRQPR